MEHRFSFPQGQGRVYQFVQSIQEKKEVSPLSWRVVLNDSTKENKKAKKIFCILKNNGKVVSAILKTQTGGRVIKFFGGWLLNHVKNRNAEGGDSTGVFPTFGWYQMRMYPNSFPEFQAHISNTLWSISTCIHCKG